MSGIAISIPLASISPAALPASPLTSALATPHIYFKSLPLIASALDTAVLPTRTRARAYSGTLVATPQQYVVLIRSVQRVDPDAIAERGFSLVFCGVRGCCFDSRFIYSVREGRLQPILDEVCTVWVGTRHRGANSPNRRFCQERRYSTAFASFLSFANLPFYFLLVEYSPGSYSTKSINLLEAVRSAHP